MAYLLCIVIAIYMWTQDTISNVQSVGQACLWSAWQFWLNLGKIEHPNKSRSRNFPKGEGGLSTIHWLDCNKTWLFEFTLCFSSYSRAWRESGRLRCTSLLLTAPDRNGKLITRISTTFIVCLLKHLPTGIITNYSLLAVILVWFLFCAKWLFSKFCFVYVGDLPWLFEATNSSLPFRHSQLFNANLFDYK